MNALSCAGSCGGYSSSSSSYYEYSSSDEAAAAAAATAAALEQKTPKIKAKTEGEIPRKIERRGRMGVRGNAPLTLSGLSHDPPLTTSAQSGAFSPTKLRKKRNSKPAKLTRRDPETAEVRKPEAAELRKPKNEKDKNRDPMGLWRGIKVKVKVGFNDGTDYDSDYDHGAEDGSETSNHDGLNFVRKTTLTRANYSQSAVPPGNKENARSAI